jgi:hypothetical protein
MAERTDPPAEGDAPKPGPGTRIAESAGTINPDVALPSVDYRARRHAGHRPPFHAIPALAGWLLLVMAAAGITTYVVNRLWWTRAELVSTHGLLPNHRLNKSVTAAAIEMGPRGRERLLVADQSNLFVGTPVKSLRYWQWFPLEQFGQPLAGATIRGLSASDGQAAIVAESGERRTLLIGALPRLGGSPILWDRPVIDASHFLRLSDDTARAALYDRRSRDWLIGAVNVAPYNADTRHWRQQLLPMSSNGAGPRINELTALGDGLVAALGSQGIDTLRFGNGKWVQADHLGRNGNAGLPGSTPRVAQFSPAFGRPAGSGDLSYLTEALGLGRVRLSAGRVEHAETLIGEGRAPGISRESLTRAAAGVGRESAWMLYRSGGKEGALGVAHYRFNTHQMSGLPAGQPIPIGSDAIITPDAHAPQTAWIGGQGLFAVAARANDILQATYAGLRDRRVEEVEPARETIFAAVKADGTPASAAGVLAAPRNLALAGRGEAWSPFIGQRRLNAAITLNDITAATDGNFNGHDSLIFGTRKDGIIVFDRVNRELFRAFTDAASAAIVAPGNLDVHARGRAIVQVGSDHSVNFYDGNDWQRLITASAADLVANRIRAAVSDMGASALVLSDGQSNAVYDARAHEWYSLPRLEVQRIEVALDSLWAVTPARALYRLPFSDPQWRRFDGVERVDDLYTRPDMVAVVGKLGTSVRVLVMKGDANEPTVVLDSNESIGDPAQWRTFALHEKQLFVAPHNGAIGQYDGATHNWSSIPLPPGVGAPRDLAVSDNGLWVVDANGVAAFRPHDGGEWVPLGERVQTLRMGTDEHTVTIQTTDGRVLIGEDGPDSLRTIVGGRLSVAPDKISAGIFFKGSLILASDTEVHRYDADRHDWDNAERTDPIVEFAATGDVLYARTKAGAVLLWNSKDLAGWDAVNDADGKPMRADRLAGSDPSSIVAVASRESGVSALFGAEPGRAKPLLRASAMAGGGKISAAVEIDRELVVATTSGAVSSYGGMAGEPPAWSKGLTNPDETGSVRELLVPRGRDDRLIVVATPQPQTTRLFVLERPGAGRAWGSARPILHNMRVARAAADASGVFAIDTRDDAPVPLARVDLGTQDEKPMIGAAFPAGTHGRAATRAIGVSPLDGGLVWRADEAGQVAAYSLIRHSWDQSSELADVDRFFDVDGKLWAWSRSRGALAENEGKGWRLHGSWREAANDARRIVLLGRDGNVVVREGRDERTIVSAPPRLPLSSASDIRGLGEHDGRLFIATNGGTLIAYEADTHRWQVVEELSEVQQFASSADHKTLFARTAQGALWRLDQGAVRWSRVDLPEDQRIVDFRQHDGHVLATDGTDGAIDLTQDFARLPGPLDYEAAPTPLYSWRFDGNAGARLMRALGDGSFVEVGLSPEGFGFDRVWAVACGRDEIQLFTEDGLVRIAGEASYRALANLDRRFVRPEGMKETAEVIGTANHGSEPWLRGDGGVWRHDGQAWQKESDENLQRAQERAKPMFWAGDTMSWSRQDIVTLTVAGGREALRYDVSSGRFDADRPTALAADRRGILILTPQGVVEYGADFSWRRISWPAGRRPSEARKTDLVTRPAEVLLKLDDGLFRWSEQGWSQFDRADDDVAGQREGSLLDGKFWRVSSRQGGAQINIAMRVADDKPFVGVSISEGRFDFERVSDVAVASGIVWIATQFGMVAVDPSTQQIKAMHKTDAPVARLATAEGTLAAQLEGGATLVYRDAQWQTGGPRELFAQAKERVVEGGPWRWRRLPTGVEVQLTSQPDGGLWAGGKPLPVRFSRNRFAFDDVRDAAFAERPWLASAAGLIGRSGINSMQIDPAVPGRLAEGNDVFAIGTPETDRALFARIDDRFVRLDNGEWHPASDAEVARSLISAKGIRNEHYEVTRQGERVQVRVECGSDAPGCYLTAEFDRSLRRFRHDMPILVTREPGDARAGLLLATRGGIAAIDVDRNVTARLYADPNRDGIGREDVKELVYLPGEKRSLARLAGRIARLDPGATRWSEAGPDDSGLLETARRVKQDDPDGWRIEVDENQPVRLFWRGQRTALVGEPASSGRGSNAARFAHDVANSAFIKDGFIVIGTRGGVVHVPLSDGGGPAASQFAITDALTPSELARRGDPRGIDFLRPGATPADFFARRDDGQAVRVSGNDVQTVAPGDPALAASQIVARDTAWTWSKDSRAPVQPRLSAIFHVPPLYNFLEGRTWSFLDIDQASRRFPHRTMVTFGDDLFVATAGGVARFATSAARAAASGSSFIRALYAEARGRGRQPMTGVVELHVTGREQLVARTKSNQFFIFDPKRDEWEPAPDASLMADLFRADLFRVADTPLLDWWFDEAGPHNIRVLPLKEEQSSYPLFSNGRFAFDDVRAILHVEDELWLATGGGVCIYDRQEFMPRRFVSRAFLDNPRAPVNPSVRELARDPSRRDRIVARMDSGTVLEGGRNGDFRRTAIALTDGLDVFEQAYMRTAPDDGGTMRLIQYPFGSYRLPEGGLRARFRDSSGYWVELGRRRDERAPPLFSRERFAFDDVRDSAFHAGQLLVATPVGVVTNRIDWRGRRSDIQAIDVWGDRNVPGQLSSMHDMEAILRMPSGALIGWNSEHVFRLMEGGRTIWQKQRDQARSPVMREQILSERDGEWRVSLDLDGAANITRIVGGRAAGQVRIGKGFSDVSRPISDREWIYLPSAGAGLIQIEKAGIR